MSELLRHRPTPRASRTVWNNSQYGVRVERRAARIPYQHTQFPHRILVAMFGSNDSCWVSVCSLHALTHSLTHSLTQEVAPTVERRVARDSSSAHGFKVLKLTFGR